MTEGRYRRKIFLGALVIEMMSKGELDRGEIIKRLDGFLTLEIDGSYSLCLQVD